MARASSSKAASIPMNRVIVIEDSIASGTQCQGRHRSLEASGLPLKASSPLVRFWMGRRMLRSPPTALSRRIYLRHFRRLHVTYGGRIRTRLQPHEGIRQPSLEAGRRAAEGLIRRTWHASPSRYFTSGEVLLPPLHLDRDDYDSGWWSMGESAIARRHLDRHARDGFWLFPGESPGEWLKMCASRVPHRLRNA